MPICSCSVFYQFSRRESWILYFGGLFWIHKKFFFLYAWRTTLLRIQPLKYIFPHTYREHPILFWIYVEKPEVLLTFPSTWLTFSAANHIIFDSSYKYIKFVQIRLGLIILLFFFWYTSCHLCLQIHSIFFSWGSFILLQFEFFSPLLFFLIQDYHGLARSLHLAFTHIIFFTHHCYFSLHSLWSYQANPMPFAVFSLFFSYFYCFNMLSSL